MITINNGILKVCINEHGGSMTSIQKDGVEYQWQGDKDSWQGQDVVIFPFIARLKDAFYLVDGKSYSMKNHGLVRYATLNVDKYKENMAELSYEWTDETLSQYPYKFKIYVKYELLQNELKVSYKVVNEDDKTIYFGIGGHPAFNLPLNRKDGFDDINGNYIEFEKEIEVNNYFEDETGCFITEKKPFRKIKRLDLSKDLFVKYKTLMFTDAKMDKVKLHRSDGLEVFMKLNNPNVVAIWTKPKYGAYICIEPWNGLPDFDIPKRELKDKELINLLLPGQEYNFGYSIII